MNKQDRYNKLDSHALRHMTTQIIDATLKDRKCWVCKKGFILAEQRDNAQTISLQQGKYIPFVHLECKPAALESVENNPNSLTYKSNDSTRDRDTTNK